MKYMIIPFIEPGVNEPVFLLRATDVAAPFALRSWAQRTDQLGGDKKIVNVALAFANEMEAYHNQHPTLEKTGAEKVKLPSWTIRLDIDIENWKEGDLGKWQKSFAESFHVLAQDKTSVRASIDIITDAPNEAEAVTAAWDTFELNKPADAFIRRVQAVVV